MLALIFIGLTTASPPGTPPYDGPTYAERSASEASVIGQFRGELLLIAVKLGAGPTAVEALFGSPSLVGQDNLGPVEWWYSGLGVRVYFPPKLVRPKGPVERIQGYILP